MPNWNNDHWHKNFRLFSIFKGGMFYEVESPLFSGTIFIRFGKSKNFKKISYSK